MVCGRKFRPLCVLSLYSASRSFESDRASINPWTVSLVAFQVSDDFKSSGVDILQAFLVSPSPQVSDMHSRALKNLPGLIP